MSMISCDQRSAITVQSVHSIFKQSVKKQNKEEMMWMRGQRRDAISVESGGRANQKPPSDKEEEKKNIKKDEKVKVNNESPENKREKRKERKEAKFAAYSRRKRKDPCLETRLSLIGLEFSQEGEKKTETKSSAIVPTIENLDDSSNTSPIDSDAKNVSNSSTLLSPPARRNALTIDIAASKDVTDSAAVFSPAFRLLVPSRTMSSILSDISNEDASMISSRISYQTAPIGDDVNSRRSSVNVMGEKMKQDANGFEDENNETAIDPFIDSEATPRIEDYPHQDFNDSRSNANLQRPVTHESLASTDSTTSTSILFPKRFSQVSSLGRLSTYEDAFPTPPYRHALDSISDDGTVLPRGSLDTTTEEEETPRPRKIKLNSNSERLREKELPPIQSAIDENERLEESSSQAQTRGERDDFLYAHNAIGLVLMPTPDGPPVPSKPPQNKTNT